MYACTDPSTHPSITNNKQAMAAAEEQATPPEERQRPLLLTRLLHAALVPYAGMLHAWVEKGGAGDTRGGHVATLKFMCMRFREWEGDRTFLPSSRGRKRE